MKKFLSGIALGGMVCLASTGVFAQDKANGEKVYKAECTSCHRPMARVKPPQKRPRCGTSAATK